MSFGDKVRALHLLLPSTLQVYCISGLIRGGGSTASPAIQPSTARIGFLGSVIVWESGIGKSGPRRFCSSSDITSIDVHESDRV
ncbi:MAG: hypothetical protein BMS9Abin28_2331 [Anaerolineae bacterium]|nr:MAG: hypothetical protein BMS9Abin28_2331 [Anaerolineae bacterium]